MKCVKHIESGKIMRVADKVAQKHVFSGSWQYIAKREWKINVRDKQKKKEGVNHA